MFYLFLISQSTQKHNLRLSTEWEHNYIKGMIIDVSFYDCETHIPNQPSEFACTSQHNVTIENLTRSKELMLIKYPLICSEKR